MLKESLIYKVATKANNKQHKPTQKAACITPIEADKLAKLRVIGTTAPLTKLGTVLVTVDRILVPNCSEAMVTKSAH